MIDDAQLLIDLVTSAGFPAQIAIGASHLVSAATTGRSDELKEAIGAAPHYELAGWAFTLAHAVSIGTRKPATPGSTYSVTASGECPACHVITTGSGSGIENYPANRLGDSFALRCLCGAEFPGVIVGVSIDPFQTVPPDGLGDDLGLDDDEDGDDE